VLCGQAEGWRLGWGVLAGHGMAAWTTAQHQIPVAPQHNPTEHSTSPTATLSGQAGELVRVLAGMALAHLRPGCDQPERERGEDREYRRRQRGGQGHPRAPAA
jgi:hypothetical protein